MNRYFRKMQIWKFVLFLILSLFVGGAGSTALLMRTLRPDSSGNPMTQIDLPLFTFLTSLIMYSLMILLFYIVGLEKHDRKAIFTKAPSRSRANLMFILAPLTIGGVFNIIFINVVQKLFPDFIEKMLQQGNISSNLKGMDNPLSIIMMFLAVVVMAPVVEEIVFRGILYNILNKRMGLIAAAVISSATFGILHGATFFQTALIGFILAVLYQVTGTLWVPVMAHALNNLYALLESVLLTNKIIVEGTQSETIYMAVFLAVSLIVIIASVIYLIKNHLSDIFRDVAPAYKTESLELLEEE